MGFLKRLWTDLSVFERDKLAFIGRGLARPNSFHRPDVIIGDFPSEFSVDPENFVFPRLEGRRRADAKADV
jgi:hypothetical protein